jgi:hypothetical protein
MEKFFTSLFDFSFSRFITPSIIRILYIICITISGVVAITSILSGFRIGMISGIISLVIAPIIFILAVCGSRVFLEVILNVFRIANYSAEVARSTRRRSSSRGGDGKTKVESTRHPTKIDDFGDF